MRAGPRIRSRRAAAAVEFAIVLVVLMPLLMGVWEVGRLVNVQQLLTNAAREAGRQAGTGEKTTAEIRQLALVYLQKSGLYKLKAVADNESELAGGGKVFVDVKVHDTTGALLAGTDARDAEQNYRLTVTLKVLYNDVEYSPTNYFLGETFRASAVVSWNCMRDVPLVVNNQIPLY